MLFRSAQALDVPLFRRVITGSALNMGSDYGSRTASENRGIAGDETEDLFALLSDVKVCMVVLMMPRIDLCSLMPV